MSQWLQIAQRPAVIRRGIKVGLIVGTALTLINYGDVMLAGNFDTVVWWKILLTYCVPFGVSTYAGVAAVKESQPPARSDEG